MMRPVWGACGAIALALGAIGLFLPLLPTVPFLLLAAFCFGRASTRLHHWLLSHPVFGPPIHNWNERGAISLRAKRFASLSIVVAFGMSLALGFGTKILILQGLALVGVAVFIWTRPSS